jgi:hypothetical protein
VKRLSESEAREILAEDIRMALSELRNDRPDLGEVEGWLVHARDVLTYMQAARKRRRHG